MLDRTRKLWEKQHGSVGDRRSLFGAVADAIDAEDVLYPGSYVDLTPSLIWPSVTYVDIDRRANQFFGDEAGVQELLIESGVERDLHEVRFVHSDYSHDLALEEQSFDLLVSLYGGFISEHCTEYLRIGGFLMVNPSHGDAAMASIDPRYRLCGAIDSIGDRFAVETDDLDTHLVPERDVDITIESLHESGRAVKYTKSPFGYLFQRIR